MIPRRPQTRSGFVAGLPLAAIACFVGCGRAPETAVVWPEDPAAQAVIAFAEATEIVRRDDGRLWNVRLEGPMLLADPETRAVWASQPDAEDRLTPHPERIEVFTGQLPEEVRLANTAMTWAGRRWSMVLLPLPADPGRRNRLLVHELFHRIQDELGLPASNPANRHLETLDGRYWLRLEWRALDRAVATHETQRGQAIEDALSFRARRRSLFPDAAVEEAALELNEGLAEYTGLALSLPVRSDFETAVREKLEQAEGTPSFLRSFAYASGPAYGILLDSASPGWRSKLTAANDLGALLGDAEGISMDGATEEDLTARSQAYEGDALHAAEERRARKIEATLADYRERLVSGRTLFLPFGEMNISFDPNSLISLGDVGTVYPTLEVSDRWGLLEVTAGGALIDPSWSGVALPAPWTLDGSIITGEGWSLKLAPGWEVVPSAGGNGRDRSTLKRSGEDQGGASGG